MSETDPYDAPSSDDDIKETEETEQIDFVDQPFAAYGGTAGFIFNVMF